MQLFQFDPGTILSFLLTLFRISVILFLMPFFGGQNIPGSVKAALLIVLSLALWPHLSFDPRLFPGNVLDLAVMLLGEAMLGLTLGLLVRFIFAAVQFGGHIIGFQMGFAMVNVVDPLTGTSEAVTAHFLYMCTMLVFLSFNGHLHLLSGLAQSFKLVPPGAFFATPALTRHVITLSSQMFVLAVHIAAPVMAALFLIDLALALISRAAPQLHVLILGFPIKITVGFFFLALLFHLLAQQISGLVAGLDTSFAQILRLSTQGAP